MSMWNEVLQEASKSLWRELGRTASKKAVETLVGEGIKAAIDLARRRALKIQTHELDERFKEEAEAKKKQKAEADAGEARDEEVCEEAPEEQVGAQSLP